MLHENILTIFMRSSKNLYYIGILTSYVIHQHHDVITKRYNTSSFWIIIVICYLLLFDIYSYYLLLISDY